MTNRTYIIERIAQRTPSGITHGYVLYSQNTKDEKFSEAISTVAAIDGHFIIFNGSRIAGISHNSSEAHILAYSLMKTTAQRHAHANDSIEDKVTDEEQLELFSTKQI